MTEHELISRQQSCKIVRFEFTAFGLIGGCTEPRDQVGPSSQVYDSSQINLAALLFYTYLLNRKTLHRAFSR